MNKSQSMTQEALKLTLEVLQDYVDEYGPWSDDSGAQYVLRVGKEALAQPEQEPVAHCTVKPLRGDESYPKTEIIWVKGRPVAGPLYTTPPQRKPLTDEKISLIAHNIDSSDWNDLNFKKCWHEGFKAGFREAEIEHNIKE